MNISTILSITSCRTIFFKGQEEIYINKAREVVLGEEQMQRGQKGARKGPEGVSHRAPRSLSIPHFIKSYWLCLVYEAITLRLRNPAILHLALGGVFTCWA